MDNKDTSDTAGDKFRIIGDPDDSIKAVDIFAKLGVFKGTNQFACSGGCGELVTVSEKKAKKLRKMKKPKVTCKRCKKARKARHRR
jgi:hypothetical protein